MAYRSSALELVKQINESTPNRKQRRAFYEKYKASIDSERMCRMFILRNMLGGKCSKCGYDKCQSALDFHHVDKATKKFSISPCMTRSMSALIAEAEKCVLLCANCHREHHAAE